MEQAMTVERFVERFQEAWRTFDPALWAELYRPDATVLGPQTRRTIGRDELIQNVARMPTLLPGFHYTVRRWAAKDETLLLEWAVTATVAGETVAWEGVDVFTLREGRVLAEVIYFDSLPLWERLDPSMRRPGLLDAVP
jgi:uncharacterized protein (TIGR02246 family)